MKNLKSNSEIETMTMKWSLCLQKKIWWLYWLIWFLGTQLYSCVSHIMLYFYSVLLCTSLGWFQNFGLVPPQKLKISHNFQDFLYSLSYYDYYIDVSELSDQHRFAGWDRLMLWHQFTRMIWHLLGNILNEMLINVSVSLDVQIYS